MKGAKQAEGTESSDLIRVRRVNVPDACQDACAGVCPEVMNEKSMQVDLCGGTWK